MLPRPLDSCAMFCLFVCCAAVVVCMHMIEHDAKKHRFVVCRGLSFTDHPLRSCQEMRP